MDRQRSMVLCAGLCADRTAYQGSNESNAIYIKFYDPKCSYPLMGVEEAYPSTINDEGTITGSFRFHSIHPSGFVPSRDGTFTAISQFAEAESAKALVPFAI